MSDLQSSYAPIVEQNPIVERLRELVLLALSDCQERLAYGVPHFYLKSQVCFLWPTTIPGSGVAGDGVLFGFWVGHLIKHKAYLFRGRSNKVVRFVVYQNLDQIKAMAVATWLDEARTLDQLKDLSRLAKK